MSRNLIIAKNSPDASSSAIALSLIEIDFRLRIFMVLSYIPSKRCGSTRRTRFAMITPASSLRGSQPFTVLRKGPEKLELLNSGKMAPDFSLGEMAEIATQTAFKPSKLGVAL
jgi:hypothetical protein